MNVFITGATGFLGHTLVKACIKKGYHVIAIVRSKEKTDLSIEDKITIVESSLEELCLSDLMKVTESDRESIFYHFAWDGTSGKERADEKKQLKNIQYSCEVLKMAIELGCKKFIYAGSIMEYEVINNIPQDYYKPSINNLYSISKLTADFMLKTIAANEGIQYNSLIISNVYGPGEKSERFLNNVIRRMLRNEEILMTEGIQLYDFIYLEDAIEAIVKVGEEGKAYASYYIGNREQRPLKEYIIEARKELNSKSEIKFGAISFQGKSLTYKEFNTNSLEELGVSLRTGFKDGIRSIKNWIMDNERE